MMKMMAPGAGFLGPVDAAPPAGAPRAVIIPFGLEHTVSWRGGTAGGPRAIIEASHQVELFDEELWCEPIRSFQLGTMAEPDIPGNTEAALDLLATMTGAALESGAFPLVLGGEHSITPGAIRPFLDRWPDLALLHFDAHADLRDGYEGEFYSHASAMRRCLDAPRLRLVSLGIRNISAGEAEYYQETRERITIHWARDKADWDVGRILAPLIGRPVYLTIDVDGFDASLMPATGTPEPGGLFWDDVMKILKPAFAALDIVGADINELAPAPPLHGCDFLAARLAYKILAYKFCRP